jgi:hypothetical protein
MGLPSLSLLRVIKWSHLSGWLFSYSDHLMKSSSHVLAYGNLCWSIGAKMISFISIDRARYFTNLELNYCSTVRALIGCSMNYCTCPCTMFSTLFISIAHDESCSTCNLTMSCKLTKSSGVPNSRRPMSLIAQLILVQLFSHSTHFSWIPWWGSWDIFTQYLADFFMRLMLLSLSNRMSCSSPSRPCYMTLMYSILSTAWCAFSYHISISLHVANAMRVSSWKSTIPTVKRCRLFVNL